MKANAKRLFATWLVLVIVLIIVSCNKAEPKDKDQTPEVSGEVTKTQEGTGDGEEANPTPDSSADASQGEDTKLEQASVQEIPIYAVNENTMEREPTVAQVVGRPVTPRLVLDEVVANFQEEIGIADVEEDGARVIVSFKEDMAPMARVSAKMENLILDCIAYSLLDNIENCEEVVYRGEKGKRYESGHLILELDEGYMNK